MVRLCLRYLVAYLALTLGFGSMVSAADESPLDLETLTRRFRIEVYRTYRNDRSEYDRRRARADAILEAWRERGAPDQDLAILTEWFEAATDASRNSVRQGLPPDPAFPRNRRNSTGASPGIGPADRALPRSNIALPDVLPDPAAVVPLERQLPLNHPRVPTHKAREPLAPDPARGDVTRKSPLVDLPGFRPQGELPPLSVDPGPPAWIDPELPDQIDSAEGFPPVWLRTELPQGMAQETVSEPKVVAATPLDALESAQSSRHYLTARRVDPPEIDVEVLAAKIRSHNLALVRIEHELAEDGVWDIKRLQELAVALSEVMRSRDHMLLFYQVLSTDQKQRAGNLNDPQIVLGSFAQRMFEVRIHHVDEDRRGAANRDLDWKKELESISKQFQQAMDSIASEQG